MNRLAPDDYRILRLLRLGPFERRARGGWRFGTRTVQDRVVDRLIAAGRAARYGDRVLLIKREARR